MNSKYILIPMEWLLLTLIFCLSSQVSAESLIKSTYAESREEFLKLSAKDNREFRFNDSQNKEFVIDHLHLPARGIKKNLLFIISGTHGIEGFVGSAVQRLWLDNLRRQPLPENLGLIMIHGLNPYGFSQFRRVNENNVDLNRNFVIHDELFKSQSSSYAKLNPFLNPMEPASNSIFSRAQFLFQSIKYILEYSMVTVRQAILQGQYEFPEGLYYGGQTYQPQKLLIDQLIESEASQYENILIIDLHTGYGKRGQLHLLAGSSKDPQSTVFEQIFGQGRVDYSDQKDFYSVDGDVIGYMKNVLQNKYKKTASGITFEFGTLDSQTTLGSIDSLHRMVNENQNWWHTSAVASDVGEIKKQFLEMFAPSDIEWQKLCWEQSAEAWIQMIHNFNSKNKTQ